MVYLVCMSHVWSCVVVSDVCVQVCMCGVSLVYAKCVWCVCVCFLWYIYGVYVMCRCEHVVYVQPVPKLSFCVVYVSGVCCMCVAYAYNICKVFQVCFCVSVWCVVCVIFECMVYFCECSILVFVSACHMGG